MVLVVSIKSSRSSVSCCFSIHCLSEVVSGKKSGYLAFKLGKFSDGVLKKIESIRNTSTFTEGGTTGYLVLLQLSISNISTKGKYFNLMLLDSEQ